jgi:hypothetical protein
MKAGFDYRAGHYFIQVNNIFGLVWIKNKYRQLKMAGLWFIKKRHAKLVEYLPS